ncbi:MAG: acyl-CoA dehydrogenase family protein [Proteobacteria bacterium]|nr:acyl-CoA dehydrogenase family protein [Pseudomonadota bacterium]
MRATRPAPSPNAAAADPVARARALAPLIEAAAPRIEAARELPADIMTALHDAGLLRLLLSRALGGAELDPPDYVEVLEAVAQADASTAWCLNQTNVCSITAVHVAPEVARAIFAPRDAVLAWGIGPKAQAVVVYGGYRVTGSWSFGSGSRHATWLGGHCPVIERDGTPRLDPDGKPTERTMLFARASAAIDPTWDVIGLKGTGSDAYSVADLFVAEDHTCIHLTRWHGVDRPDLAPPYRFGATSLYAAGFAMVALGNARAMLESFKTLAGAKAPRGYKTMLRDNAVVQSQVAQAEMQLRTARVYLIDFLAGCRAAVTQAGRLTMDQRMTIRMAATYAIQQATHVAETMYRAAGTTAIFESQPFERRFRDAYTICQHLQGRAMHFETVGKHLLGLEPEPLFL